MKLRASIAVWINILYHIVKVVVPASTLISCVSISLNECQDLTTKRIQMMLYADTAFASGTFTYESYTMLKLIYVSWKYSRLESR